MHSCACAICPSQAACVLDGHAEALYNNRFRLAFKVFQLVLPFSTATATVFAVYSQSIASAGA